MKKSLFILLLPIILFASLQKVSVQLEWKHQFEFAGFYAAIEQGYYKKIGLDVTLKEYEDGINISDDVIKQKSTFGISSSSLILERLRNKPIILLASYFKHNALAFLTKPNIKLPSDLRGKKIMAVPWEMEHTSIGVLLKEHDINNTDYTLIKNDFKVDKFINGEVDAMSVFVTNQPYLIDKAKIKYNIINPADYGIYSYDVELFTSEKIANQDTQMVKNFIKATNKGWEYAFKHKQEIVNLIYNKYTKLKSKDALLFEANAIEKIFRLNIFKIGSIAPELIQLNAEIFEKLKLVKGIDFQKLISSYIFKPFKNTLKLQKDKKNFILLSEEEINYLKNKKEIKMCIDPSWMPYEALVDGKHVGMAADFFKIFQKKINAPIRIIKTKDWSESLEFAKQRRCDIFSLAMATPTREKYMNFTTPYITGPLVLATKISTPFIVNLKNLKNKNIGIPKGYAASEILQDKYPNLNFIDVENIRDGLNRVNKGKLFGYIGTLPSIGHMFQKEFIGELKIAGKFDEFWKLGVGVRNDDKILLNIFQKAVNSLNTDEKQAILNKWISINYEKGVDYSLIWKLMFLIILIVIGSIYWNRKISKLNKALKKEKNRAQNAMQIKSNFLANVSHEIRTPMNSIIGMTYLVKQTQLSKVQKKYLTRIDTASHNLLQLINDILDLSKIEANKMHLSNVNFNLNTLLDNINNLAKIKADEKDISFHITYDKSKEMELYGDNIKLSQIINNLISNAIKFTQNGRVDLIVEQSSQEKFKFSVIDTGIGLKQEQIGKLFSSFSQADESTTRKYGGTGLGLAITKELVHLMGGKIWVESKYGEGSKFIVEVDLKINHNHEVNKTGAKNTTIKRDKIKPKKVLDFDKKDDLYNQLQEAIDSRRPHRCKPIIEEIELYTLDFTEQELFEKIKKLISQYKFNEAMELLDER